MITATPDAAPVPHAALFHEGDGELVDASLPYLEEGLDRGEAVVVALPPEHLDLIAKSLGTAAAEHVGFVDITTLGRNPGRVLPELALYQRDHGRHRRVRALGSPVWPGRTPVELDACREHDALMNLVLPHVPATVMCPFDRGTLDTDTIAWARTTHPVVLEDGRWSANPGFADPLAVATAARGPLPEPEDVGEALVFTAPDGPRLVRRAVADHGRRHGLDEDQVADLCLAVHEAAVNTVVHTEGPGILGLWAEPGSVVCQVQDAGFISDPLVGRHPPVPEDGRGYGLFLINRICDLVRVHSEPGEGTTVRMWMHRRAPAA